MNKVMGAAAGLLLLGMSGVAMADPQCTNEPKSKWMDEEAFKQKVVAEQGITEIVRFVVTDTNCYEIYGKKGDKKVEIYFDPVTAAVIESEEE
ncbi:MAG TPA: PepSY domain-containing protein [Geminicoccus sp.]|jgi:hypothetical protein|uniref:PepSY domain-containing protein n=1 Tax=Geminicoccus sp. TaxID=2024832 RepID=UPI002E359805|nr:PepSY domain-containing protein [Geminicoccus sp.]HEX2529082.1 PepSY domain-containing protein [Geminicoccus sp.]